MKVKNNKSSIPVSRTSISSKLNILNHYGFTTDEFLQIKDLIYQEDYIISKYLNNVFMFTMLIFLFFSILGIVPYNYWVKYAFFFLISLILKLITISWDKRNTSYLHFSNRCVVIILFCFGIAESVFDPFVVATAILPLFVICSTICANSFLEYSLISLLSLAAFIFSSYVTKSTEILHGDIVNSITFSLISIILHYFFQKTRIERFYINSKLQEAKKQISMNATFDVLSGAINRGIFFNETNKIFEKNHGNIAVCLLDIDNFKYINDTFGHEKGDEAIQAIGEAILQSLDLSALDYDTIIDDLSSKKCDYFGRLGGDEFFIVIRKDTTIDNVKAFIEYLQELVHGINFERHNLSFSMGAMIVPSDVHDFQEVYSKVDLALYKSKEDGKDRYTFYSSDLENLFPPHNS